MSNMTSARQGSSASRTLLFAGRTAREILRDPLSFVFCLGVPLCMLVAMYLLFSSTEGTGLFLLRSLTPGIAVFSGTFTMLYMALQVSRDRATWFLTRLYTSPMRTMDFVLGYALPGTIIGVGQVVICWLTAVVTGLITGNTDWIRLLPILRAVLSVLPMTVTFVFFGITFGSLFSDKAAPGLSSIIISAAGFLSGAWMPVESMAEGFQFFCTCLPFYPAVLAGRVALTDADLTMDGFWKYILIDIGWCVLVAVAACLSFALKARREAE